MNTVTRIRERRTEGQERPSFLFTAEQRAFIRSSLNAEQLALLELIAEEVTHLHPENWKLGVLDILDRQRERIER